MDTEDPLPELDTLRDAALSADATTARHAAAIYQGEELILAGDDISIGMVFNNTTGANFEGRPDEHRDYLERVGVMLQMTIEPSRLRRLPS